MANSVVRMNFIEVAVGRVKKLPIGVEANVDAVGEKYRIEVWMSCEVLAASVECTDDIEAPGSGCALDSVDGAPDLRFASEAVKQSVR